MKWQTLLSTLLLCGVSTICSAQMYKWVDEQGDTHYSEIPPPKGDVTTVAPPPPPAVAPAQAQQQLEQRQEKLNELADQRSKASADAALEDQQQKDMRTNCERAKATLAGLYAGGNRLYKDSKGNVTRMNEKQRQENIEKAQEMRRKYCKR